MAGQKRYSDIDVDASDFLAGLERQVKRMKLDSHEDLIRLGYDVMNRAKELCPVDTGRLRASIDVSDGRDAQGSYVDVGTIVEYAPYVEFGTRFQSAQPYLRPAMAEAISGWRPRI